MLRPLLLACLLVAACSAPQPAPQPVGQPAAQPATQPATQPAAGALTCTGRGPLPDPACTPGATDPAVSPANLGRTICRRGYSAGVRPPVDYTDTLKRQQMAAYGDSEPASRYEEDHLIPLELGGSPRDPHNLWPEPRDSLLPGQGAETKDSLENVLHGEVCAGRLALGDAQRAIASDWWSAYRIYVGG